MRPRVADVVPDEILDDDGTNFLRWDIPYRKKDGSAGRVFLMMGGTLEQYNNNQFAKQDAQDTLDKYIENVSRET